MESSQPVRPYYRRRVNAIDALFSGRFVRPYSRARHGRISTGSQTRSRRAHVPLVRRRRRRRRWFSVRIRRPFYGPNVRARALSRPTIYAVSKLGPAIDIGRGSVVTRRVQKLGICHVSRDNGPRA